MVNGSNRPSKRPGESGFTLIELIVVVTIIGVLAGIAVVNVLHAQRKAAENVLRADLALMRKAIDDFYADKQRYPGSLQELVDARYMRKLPPDPITNSSETWQDVFDTGMGEDDPFGSSDGDYSPPGVMDVKSGADGETLEGTPYSEL
jgi:general secretion pathway protein G